MTIAEAAVDVIIIIHRVVIANPEILAISVVEEVVPVAAETSKIITVSHKAEKVMTNIII